MCCGCWREKGGYTIVNDRVTAVAEFVEDNAAFLEYGPCHICFDDENIEDTHLLMCLESCDEPREVVQPWESQEAFAEEATICRQFVALLQGLTYEERVSAFGYIDACFSVKGQS